MKHIKENLPLILLVGITPYFFYGSPTISQAIIATALAALVGFKYYLEYNSLPDYKSLFEEQLTKRDELVTTQVNQLIKEINKVRERQGVINMNDAAASKRESAGW
jgi:hypothetical protein|tara:strand:+ start:3573 stop:3890 length:318 start_codon:yes stop_codon:yes gene_type:complete